jgi:transposase InsO family protein
VKYAFIRDHAQTHSVQRLCELMEVSRAAYYEWLERPESPRLQADRALLGELTQLHFELKEACGSVRLSREMARRGRQVGKHRIARIKRIYGLWTRRHKRFVRTTRSRPDHCVYPNSLNRQFTVDRPNAVWVSDVTAVWTLQGWLYVAVVLDLYSRRVIGWSSGSTFDTALTLSALDQALRRRSRPAGLMHHSDRGAHYSSSGYQDRLKAKGIIASMSRAGNCYDNAVAESFFSSLKNEETLHHRYATREEARSALYDYIEVFYNRKRLHSTLGYVSPVEFERQMKAA